MKTNGSMIHRLLSEGEKKASSPTSHTSHTSLLTLFPFLYTGWHRPLCMWNMLSTADWMFSLASNMLYLGCVGVNTMLIYCTVRKIWSLSSQRVRTYSCNPLDSVYSIFAVKLSYSTCSHPPVCCFHFVLFHRFFPPHLSFGKELQAEQFWLHNSSLS